MRRVLALGIALFALIAAGFLWTRDRPVAVANETARAIVAPVAAADDAEPAELVAPLAEMGPQQREARRFGRYDKDHDDRITRDEYLAARRKSFAKLDVNGDGKLSFEEYATSTVKKFGKADRNGDGVLVASEFATTAVKRKAKAACVCAKEAEQ